MICPSCGKEVEVGVSELLIGCQTLITPYTKINQTTGIIGRTHAVASWRVIAARYAAGFPVPKMTWDQIQVQMTASRVPWTG